MSDLKPYEVLFRGPETTDVRIREDGPELIVGGRGVLEWGDLQRLVEVIHAAAAAWEAGQVPVPAPPSREDSRRFYGEQREAWMAKRAQRAIAREFAPEAGEPR